MVGNGQVREGREGWRREGKSRKGRGRAGWIRAGKGREGKGRTGKGESVPGNTEKLTNRKTYCRRVGEVIFPTEGLRAHWGSGACRNWRVVDRESGRWTTLLIPEADGGEREGTRTGLTCALPSSSCCSRSWQTSHREGRALAPGDPGDLTLDTCTWERKRHERQSGVSSVDG